MNIKAKNRIALCACGSKKNGTDCCLPFINAFKQDGVFAKSAEVLMRSRYTAFALGKERYILDSWHPDTRPQCLDLDTSIQWCGLKVLTVSKEKNNIAFVEFVARFRSSTEMGQMHERSRFLFEAGRWFYVDGEQIETASPQSFKAPARNDPCICGSAKKYKKCCGK